MLNFFKKKKSKYPQISDLEERDGVYFLAGETKPFSGHAEYTYEDKIIYHENWRDPEFVQIIKRMEFLHGRLNGTTSDTLQDGTIARRYIYKHGELEELYRYNLRDGGLDTEENYKNGQLHGSWRSFWPLSDNAILEEGEYENGEKNGLWKRYSSNGVVASIGQYKKGEKFGQWEYFDDETGNKTRIEILQNDKVIKSLYFSNGALRDGEHKHFSHDGSLDAVENYKNGIPHGKFTDFDDGAVWRTRWFKDGALHGRVETFDKDGKLEGVSIFENGKEIT